MAGRFPSPIPHELEKAEWTRRLGTGIKRWMESIQAAVGGSQGTPSVPTTILAGVSASRGTSQAQAASDHVHDVSTATPSVPVAFGGAADEGVSPSLLRSDAKLILASGSASGDILVWNGTAWVSTSLPIAIADNDVLAWLDL